MEEERDGDGATGYYDPEGGQLDPSEIDWSDKLIEAREGGGFTVRPVSGEAKTKRDETLELVASYKGLRDTDYISAKVMDALLSVSSITDLLKALASFGDEYREKVAEREAFRERIRELEAAGVAPVPDAAEVLGGGGSA